MKIRLRYFDLSAFFTALLLAIPSAFSSAHANTTVLSYQLHQEIWTNLGGNGGASIGTSYRYDDKGSRILKETRPAADTLGPVLGSTSYTYDSLGRPLKTFLKGLTDTLSAVEYRYDAKGNLSATFTEDKDGKVQLQDSLFYDNGGRLVEARRWAGSEKTQAHHFNYDSTGRLVSDTLYEKQGAGFLPAKAILTAYGPDGIPSNESHFRRVEDLWYLVQTVKMRYTAGKLTSLTRYLGDGAGATLADSIDYAYDRYGNRLHEKGFDEERQPTYSIDFEWRALGTEGIRQLDPKPIGIAIRTKAGSIFVARQNALPLVVSLRDTRGKLICQKTFGNDSNLEVEFTLPATLAKGVYLAEVNQASRRSAIAVMVP
jgi:hypothetical protein